MAPCAEAAERVVVLRNGNVFRGQVTEQEYRVLVKSTNRQVAFEPHDVDFVATDFVAAYHVMANRITPANTASRERLLAWCMRHGLTIQAREQLDLLSHHHPQLPQLDLLRRQIDSHHKLMGKVVLPTKLPYHPDTQRTMDVQSRLSKETKSQFVRTVQPIFLNRCAQANCHGRATKNNFALRRSGRATLPRSLTQRNLGTALRQIGSDAPQLSLLWMSVSEAHGGATEHPLSPAELDRVLGWILLAHRDVHGVSGSPQRDLRTAAIESDKDPFDPAEFNRLR